jgi:hypothetical protein
MINSEITDSCTAIFKRKSISKFDLVPLEDILLLNIAIQLKRLNALYPEIKTEIKIVSKEDVKGLIQVKAPHYLVAFSETQEGYLSNVGFILQQMDLYFSANGIGCCWQGWPKPTHELRTNQNLEFVIAMAFGKPKEKLHRESPDEFKRKPLAQITSTNELEELLEPARLAPTPSQPWFFTNDEQTIHAFCQKPSGIRGFIYKRLNKIEMGIALCHIWISALHHHKQIEFITKVSKSTKIPKGHFHIASVKVS